MARAPAVMSRNPFESSYNLSTASRIKVQTYVRIQGLNDLSVLSINIMPS